MRTHASHRRPLLGGLTALAAIWCALILVPPWLGATGHRGAEAAVRIFFSAVCHQIPARSLAIGGEPLAVCARCAGIYLGFLAGCLVAMAMPLAPRRPAAPRRADLGRAPLLLASLPSVLEYLAEWSGLLTNAPLARALAGALFGSTVVLYVLPAIEELPTELAGLLRCPPPADRRTHARSS